MRRRRKIGNRTRDAKRKMRQRSDKVLVKLRVQHTIAVSRVPPAVTAKAKARARQTRMTRPVKRRGR